MSTVPLTGHPTAQAWVSADLNTGAIVADLIGLTVDSVSKTMSTIETTTGALPLAATRSPWASTTLPYLTCLHLLDLIDGDWVPTWSGIVIGRQRTASTDSLSLSLATVEAYFDRVYIRDETFTATGQLSIAKSLIDKYCGGGNGLRGIPIRVVLLGGAGHVRDVQYRYENMTTVFGALNDLMALDDHDIEYTISTEWTGENSLGFVCTIGEVDGVRVGKKVVPPLGADAVFDLPGCLTEAVLGEDWSGGHGANYVTFLSPTTNTIVPGAEAPESAVQSSYPAVNGLYRPVVMWKTTAVNTATDKIVSMAQLNALAAAALKVIKVGSNTLQLTARSDAGPTLGKDYDIGDDVGWALHGLSFPGGFSGIGHLLGYIRTLGAQPSVELVLEGDSIDAYVSGDGTFKPPKDPIGPIDPPWPPDDPPDPDVPDPVEPPDYPPDPPPDWADTAGIFVAVGGYGFSDKRGATSPDGIAWTAFPGDGMASGAYRGIAWGLGTFVAVADGVMAPDNAAVTGTSLNGATWTEQAIPLFNYAYWSAVAYGNYTFVAVSNFSTTAGASTSPDGVTWESHAMPTSISGWKSITYGKGLFVAVAVGMIVTSPDGITWTTRTLPAGPPNPENASWWGVTFGNGKFVAVGDSWWDAGGLIATSSDGITWVVQANALAARAVCWGGGKYVAVAPSDGISAAALVSPDGVTWTRHNFPSTTSDVLAVVYGNGMYVATCGSQLYVLTSPDGVTWTQRTPGWGYTEGYAVVFAPLWGSD